MLYQSPPKAGSSAKAAALDQAVALKSPLGKSKSSIEGRLSPRAAAQERSAIGGEFSELVELAEDDEAGGAILKKLYCIHTKFVLEIDDDLTVDSEEIRKERELSGRAQGVEEEEKVLNRRHNMFEEPPVTAKGGKKGHEGG